MAKTKIGIVAIVNKGLYNAETTYSVLNTVIANGGTYISKVNNNVGNPVTDTNYWVLQTEGINKITEVINGLTHTYAITYTSGASYQFAINDGYTPVKGVDYFTPEDINSLNIPRNTSDLTNNSGFITKSVNDLDNYTQSNDLSAVATSGNYNDLNNKPTNVSSFLNDAGYYDKPSGGIPKTDLASDVQTSLGKADTAIQNHQDISGKEDKQNKTNNLDENSTNNQYPSAKAVYNEIKGIKENVDDISARTAVLENKTGKVYGVRRKITNNTSSAWERIGDSSQLTANATKDGTAVQNDFDNLYPWSDIISFNLNLETGEKMAFYGEPDFKFDGSNGDVYTYIPHFWYKVWQDEEYDYIQIADYPAKGFTEAKEFSLARYLTNLIDEKLRSVSGAPTAAYKSMKTYRDLVKTGLGENYCLMDYRYFLIQILYLVEYADYNSQNKLGNGLCGMRHNTNDVALISEENVNRFIVNGTAGKAFIVGQQVSIGAYESANAKVRTITAINDYNVNDVIGKEIIFDGKPLNIATTDKIWSSVQNSGGCDSLGMKSGCLSNDSKHAVAYRGIENIFGNIFAFVDGINTKNRIAYVCYEPTKYESDKFSEPYEKLGYTNMDSNGYPKLIGFDKKHPLVKFPFEAGGSSTTGTTDYYWQDAGNFVARVGGCLHYSSGCGLWCWALHTTSSSAIWTCGARVLKYQ